MWSFTKIGAQEEDRDSKYEEFFDGAGESDSLIRESLQNALDALDLSTGEKVKVLIKIGEANSNDLPELFDKFNHHAELVRKQEKRELPENIEKKYKYILFEDFNSTGLTGKIEKDTGDQSCLYSFWWNYGQGKKIKASGGSHGIGKITLSQASKSRCFFAFSKRNDDNQEILLGYSLLGKHTNKDNGWYRPYARFGNCNEISSDDSQLVPYVGGDICDKFKSKYLKRKDESGTSIFIPNIDNESINIDSVLLAIVRNFYLPIIKNSLEVELEDHELNRKYKIDSHSIDKIYNGLDPKKIESDDIGALIKLAKDSVNSAGYITSTDFKFTKEKNKLYPESFSKENLIKMRKEFMNGKPIICTFGIPLFPYEKEEEVGYVKIALQKENNTESNDKNAKVDFFRGDILIKEETLESKKNISAFILDIPKYLDKGKYNPLSEFFKYFEDPGHVKWQRKKVNRENERKKYKDTGYWQKRLVKNMGVFLLNILNNEKEEKIENFADDLFYLVTDGSENSGPKRGKNKVNDKRGDVPPPPPRPDKILNELVQFEKIDDGGVRIKSTSFLKKNFKNLEKDKLLEKKLVAAYSLFGKSKQSSVKGFNEIDFNFLAEKDIKINYEGIKVIRTEPNKIIFDIQKENFYIEINGFDANRDLHLDVKGGSVFYDNS